MPCSCGAADGQRRQAVVARRRPSAPISAQRLDDPVDRPAADRLVAVERPLAARLPGEPAGQEPQQRAGVADVDRGRARAAQPDPADPQVDGRGVRRDSRLVPEPASDLGAERLDRRERRARVGGVEVAAIRVSPSAIAATIAARWEIDLSGGGVSVPRSGPAGSKRASSLAGRRRPRPTWPRLADDLGGALGLARPGDPDRDRAGAHVGRRVERHVLDVDPARPSASAISATVPGRFSTPIRSSRRSPPTRSDSSSRRRSSPAARVPRADRRRASPARISSAASRRRSPTASISAATASRLVAKMSPQIAGLAPATRVVSRKLGPTSGRRSDSSESAAAASLDEHVGEHVRQVADRRHHPVVGLGVDRLRPGAELGDGALQAVVVEAARVARSGSGTSARPRAARRARSRPRRSRRRRAGGRR